MRDIVKRFKNEDLAVYCETEDEAKFALDMYNFCKERSFEPDWNDEKQEKWSIYLVNSNKKVKVDYSQTTCYFGPFYYPTEEVAQEVIDKYSFEELAKYYGRV